MLRNPTHMMRLGMLALVVANLVSFYARKSSAGDALDGPVGFFYGVAIGALLLSVRLRSRTRAGGDGAPSC